MKRAYLSSSILSVVLLGSAASLRADFVTVLPTPDGFDPISHYLSGTVSPAQVQPANNLNIRLSSESPSDPDNLFAKATYTLTDSAFFVSNISMHRTAGTYAGIRGEIFFQTNQQVYYSLAGLLNISGAGTGGHSFIRSILINRDTSSTVFDFNNTNYTDTSASLDVIDGVGSTPSAANGLLDANTNYLWYFEVATDSNPSATNAASATGDMTLNFSWTGDPIPEPAGLGLLAAAACGLLLRRRR